MKKLSIILLSIILCVSFCACSNAKTEDNASSTTVADVGASIARPNDEAESNENTSNNEATTTSIDVSNSKETTTIKSDVIQNNTTTTKNNNSNNKDKPTKNSNQDPTEQDNIHVNAEDLVGGNYFD